MLLSSPLLLLNTVCRITPDSSDPVFSVLVNCRRQHRTRIINQNNKPLIFYKMFCQFKYLLNYCWKSIVKPIIFSIIAWCGLVESGFESSLNPSLDSEGEGLSRVSSLSGTQAYNWPIQGSVLDPCPCQFQPGVWPSKNTTWVWPSKNTAWVWPSKNTARVWPSKNTAWVWPSRIPAWRGARGQGPYWEKIILACGWARGRNNVSYPTAGSPPHYPTTLFHHYIPCAASDQF